MTYIAALHCQNGIVMCADTLETYGDYKNYVEKLAIVEDRSYPLAIGGAGIEDLIDPFTQEVLERTSRVRPSTKEEFKRTIVDCVTEVYRNDLPWLVVKKQHRTPEFLIAAKPQGDDFCILRIKGRRIYPVVKHALIGYGTNYNQSLLSRLHQDSLPMSQTVALAVYLVSQSKQFDVGVGGETRVVVVTPGGAFLEEREWIADLEKRANEVLPLVDALFLACGDIGLSKAQFDEKIECFIKASRCIRDRHINFAAARAVLKNFMIDDPYPKFPLGGRIRIGQDSSGAPVFEASDSPSWKGTEDQEPDKKEPSQHDKRHE